MKTTKDNGGTDKGERWKTERLHNTKSSHAGISKSEFSLSVESKLMRDRQRNNLTLFR